MGLLINNGIVYGTSRYQLADMIKSTLKANETEVTFEDSRLNTKSTVDPYVDDSVFGEIYPTGISFTDGTCTITYNKAPDSDVEVAIKVLETAEYSTGTFIKGTLTAGQTTIELTSSDITSTSIIDTPFFWVEGNVETEPICYETIKVENGKVTMTFAERDTDLLIGIKVM